MVQRSNRKIAAWNTDLILIDSLHNEIHAGGLSRCKQDCVWLEWLDDTVWHGHNTHTHSGIFTKSSSGAHDFASSQFFFYLLWSSLRCKWAQTQFIWFAWSAAKQDLMLAARVVLKPVILVEEKTFFGIASMLSSHKRKAVCEGMLNSLMLSAQQKDQWLNEIWKINTD